MGHTISDRRRRERMKEFGVEDESSPKAKARRARHCRRLIALWNGIIARGQQPTFFPTIGAAIGAGTPWLHVLCPACRTIGEVDLRKLDRHRAAPISSLIPSLSCRRCCENPPFAELVGLTSTPAVASHWTEQDEWAARRESR